jgi:hypothetical protein
VLNDLSPPELLGDAAEVGAVASTAAALAEDEAGRLRAQLEAVQEATLGQSGRRPVLRRSTPKPRRNFSVSFQ